MVERHDATSVSGQPVSLARLVRAFREQVPLTQEELADRSGLSLSTVRSLESGRVLRPHSGSVRRLVAALGVAGVDREALVAVARGQTPEATRLVGDPGPSPGADAAHHVATSASPVRSIGRELELTRLRKALADALAGRGRTVLVTGEPGIGKTLLVEDLARAGGDEGARVIVVRCPGTQGAPAYWPWSAALRACDGDSPAGVDRLVGDGIGRLLPDSTIAATWPSEDGDDASRRELFHRVVSVFHGMARRCALVLVLDDLHWADAPSLRLFELLGSTIPTLPVLLFGTYRDSDGVDDRPVDRLAARLPADTSRIALPPLGAAALERLVAATAGVTLSPTLASWVHRHTGGNPLFAQEVVHLLAAEDRLDRRPGDLVLPVGVRGVIERRLLGFDPPMADVLRWAALCGDDFSQGLVERASGLPTGEVGTALAAAGRSRLVRPLAGRPGWQTFSHGLVAETLRDTTPPPERARRHLRLGEVLAADADDRPTAVAEISHHLFAALPKGDIDVAANFAVRAARQAAEALAWEQAARHYDQAIQALRLAAGSAQPVAELLVERAEVLARVEAAGRVGDDPGGRRAAREAVDAARRHGSPQLLARAALVYSDRTLADTGGPATMDVLEEALGRLGPDDGALQAVLTARLAEETYHLDRRRFHDLTEEALGIADRVDDLAARWEALTQKHRALRGSVDIEGRTATSRELVALASRCGEHERELLSRLQRVVDLMTAGHRLPLDREVEAFARTVDRARLRSFGWFVPLWRASRATADGRLAEAEVLAGEALRLTAGRGEYALGQLAVLLAGIRTQQCRLAEVEPAIAAATDQHPTMPVYRCALAAIHGELGRPASAQALLEPLAADGFADVPANNDWILAAHCIAEACVTIPRPDWGRAIYHRLLPYARQHVASSSGALYLGPAGRALGLLATQAGDLDVADTHYRHALADAQRFGTALWTAQVELDWATLLAARDRPGDQEAARRLVDEARAFAEERDIPRLRRQLAARLDL